MCSRRSKTIVTAVVIRSSIFRQTGLENRGDLEMNEFVAVAAAAAAVPVGRANARESSRVLCAA